MAKTSYYTVCVTDYGEVKVKDTKLFQRVYDAAYVPAEETRYNEYTGEPYKIKTRVPADNDAYKALRGYEQHITKLAEPHYMAGTWFEDVAPVTFDEWVADKGYAI